MLFGTVTSVIRRVTLTPTGCKATDKQVKAVCKTRNFAYARSLLCDFSDQRADVKLDEGSNFFSDVTLFFLCCLS